MIKTIRLKSLKCLVVTLLLSLLLTRPVLADDQKKIVTHDPNSKITINYEVLNLLYKATVTSASLSSRVYAQKAVSGIGTRLTSANNNPTRMESSRVFYHKIKDEELGYIHDIRLAMEAIPELTPLETLNRDEQLAYWLNLYNITVFEQLAQRYPIQNLKKIRKGSSDNPSMWDEKILSVNGIAMSLNDIQYDIIQKIWPDPIVLYGMYQGAIGGPNLRKWAYTGKLVYQQLEDNAIEFVNSLRGLRFRGKNALASEMYHWNSELFPDFETDLRTHLRKYTNLRLTTRLDASWNLNADVYDWYIADIINGGFPIAGGAASTNPVALVMAFGVGTNTTDRAWNTAIARNRLPHGAAVFLKKFVSHNKKLRDGRVTVEEIDKKDIEQIQVK